MPTTRWKVWGSPKSVGFILRGSWMSEPNSNSCWDISVWTEVVDPTKTSNVHLTTAALSLCVEEKEKWTFPFEKASPVQTSGSTWGPEKHNSPAEASVLWTQSQLNQDCFLKSAVYRRNTFSQGLTVVHTHVKTTKVSLHFRFFPPNRDEELLSLLPGAPELQLTT